MQKGLYIENNRLLLNGKEFYGMGLNFFDGFARTSSTSPNNNYQDSLRKISEYKIPFIRLMFGCYYASSWKEYIESPDTFFRRMDEFVSTCEKYHVGIIASLFWWIGGIPDLAGESINSIGKRDSRTMRLAKKYVNDVVNRYIDSPAIWGWEIGNEYNLSADLGLDIISEIPVGSGFGAPEVRTEEDLVSSSDVNTFFSEISKEIRRIDKHRIISNGDADYRSSQYHLRTSKSWIEDSIAELHEIMDYFAPDPIDVVSVHIYELEQHRFGKDVGFEDLLKTYNQITSSMNKILYLGEFGATDSEEKMKRQFNAILDTEIQLSSPWNYNMIGLTHGSFSDTGIGSHMFYGTAEINQTYRSKGLQNVEDYWNETDNTRF